MNEVEINGVRYRIGKLPAMDQFHVSRRILPVAQGLGRGLASLSSLAAATNGQDTGNGEAQAVTETGEEGLNGTLLEAFGPVADALSKMSDADSEYIIKKCLIPCLRFNEQAQTWVRIMAPNGQPMFDDMDMMTMIRLTYEVIVENVFPSLRGLFSQNSAAEVSTSSSI